MKGRNAPTDDGEIDPPERAAGLAAHENNFGALRLLLATMVIVGHSPPLAGASAEGASRIVAKIAPHELAVDGFFLLSGYLITVSAFRSGTLSYLRKRVSRIYPGFAVAYVLSVALASLAGGILPSPLGWTLMRHALAVLRLAQPIMPGAYAHNPYPVVNGSLWTCAYEFACYLMVLLLQRWGLLRKGYLLPTAILMLFAVAAFAPYSDVWYLHKLYNPARLASLFLVGSLFYLWRADVPYGARAAAISAVAFCVAALMGPLGLAGIALFGGYLLFWSGFARAPAFLRRIGARTDISYGVYLYAWPIQNLLVWHCPGISPWTVCAVTIPLAYCAGLLSWILVEARFLRRSSPRTS